MPVLHYFIFYHAIVHETQTHDGYIDEIITELRQSCMILFLYVYLLYVNVALNFCDDSCCTE